MMQCTNLSNLDEKNVLIRYYDDVIYSESFLKIFFWMNFLKCPKCNGFFIQEKGSIAEKHKTIGTKKSIKC